MPTIKGFEVEVLVDPYRKGVGEFGPWREITYLVKWPDSDNFIDAICGLNGSANPGDLVDIPLPHAYPGNERLLCSSAESEPVGDGRPDEAKLYASEFAVVTARYGVPPFDIIGQDHAHAIGGVALPYTRFESRGYTESVRFPASGLQDDLGDPATRDKQVDIPAQEIAVTRYFNPYNPDNDPGFVAAVGGLNAGVFLNRPEGTVKFESYDTSPQTAPDGRPVTTVRMMFRWRPYDWNAEPIDKDGEIAWGILKDAAGNTPLPYVDLEPVLKFGLA